MSCIRHLLEHGGCPVAAGDVFHVCPLLHAVSHGNEHIVLELLERGAPIDGPPLASETPATLAAFLGWWCFVALLCFHCLARVLVVFFLACRTNFSKFKHPPACHGIRAWAGDFGLMKLLVARGASMERVNANGENVEEVLQEIHRLSLKDAEELNLDDVVKVRVGILLN